MKKRKNDNAMKDKIVDAALEVMMGAREHLPETDPCYGLVMKVNVENVGGRKITEDRIISTKHALKKDIKNGDSSQ